MLSLLAQPPGDSYLVEHRRGGDPCSGHAIKSTLTLSCYWKSMSFKLKCLSAFGYLYSISLNLGSLLMTRILLFVDCLLVLYSAWTQ